MTTTERTVDFYTYRRFRIRCTVEQAAYVYYHQAPYRDTLPPSQRDYYEWVIWQFLNLKLPPPTS